MKNNSLEEKQAKAVKLWSLYVIRCANNSLYCGITNEVQRRFKEHQAMGKRSAKYLRGKGPLEMVFQCEIGDRSAASKMESRFKSLNKREKEKIVLLQSLELIEPMRPDL